MKCLSNTVNRDTYIDTLKFITIALVIWGHIIEPYIENNELLKSMYSFIYFIHMPLFTLLSGYFSKNNDIKKINISSLKILETYIVIQLVWAIIPSLILGKYSWNLLFEPHWILWYLVSLISWKYISFVLNSLIGDKKYVIIPLTFVLAIVVGFIPQIGFPLSISRTLVFLPFFMIGYFMTASDMLRLRTGSKLKSLFVLLVLGIGCYCYKDSYIITNKILWGSRAYELISDSFWIWLLRPLCFLISYIAVINIFSLIQPNQLFASLGKKTMMFYIYHGPCVIIFYKIIAKFSILPNVALLLISTFSIISVIAIFSKFKISQILLNPLSFIQSYIKK